MRSSLATWVSTARPFSRVPRDPQNPRAGGRLTVRSEYPDSPPSEVTFGLLPRYGIHNARDAHDWFLRIMREHEEFEVETDEPGELPLSFWSETVRRVVVE